MSRLGMNLISPEVITENQAGMSQEAGPGDFVRGMRAGTYGMGSSLANTGGALANAFGADQAAEGMYGTAQQLQGRAQATGPRIASLAQLEQAGYTPGNMIDYAQGVLGNVVPSAAVGMIPGMMASTPLRALGAATAAYTPMEMGDVVGKMREDNGGQPLTAEDTLQAAGTGIASAGLQSVVPAVVGAKVAGRALGEVGRAAPQSLARTMGQNVVGGGLMEGAMEGGSEALKQVGAGRDQIDWDQVKENAIAGAIGGGGMGIAGGVGDYAHSRADKIGGVLSGAMGRAKDKVTDTVGTLPGDAKTAAGDVWEAVRAGAAGAFEGFNASELGKTLNERAASIKTKVDDIMADEYVPEDIKQKAAAAAKNMGDKANQAFVWGVDKARKARDGFNDLTKDEGDDDTRTKVDKALGVLRKATGKAEDGIRNYLTPFENAEEEAAWTARLTTDPEGAAQDFRSAEGKLRTTNQARAEKIVSDPGYNEAQKQMAAAILSEPGEDPTADANAIAGLVTAKGLGDKIDTVVKAGKKVTSIFSRANDTKNNDNRNSLDFSGVDELLVKDIVEVLPEGFAEHRTKLATLASTVREVMRGISTRKAHADDINQATGLDKLKGASIDIQLQNFEDRLAEGFGEDTARKVMMVVADRLGKLDPKSANDYAAYVTNANDKYATTADLKQKLVPMLDAANRLKLTPKDLEAIIPHIGEWIHTDPQTPMERMKVKEARMGLEIAFGKNWKVASRIIEDAYKPKRPSAPSATRKSLPSDDNDSAQDWDEAGYKIAEAEENFLKGPDATGYEGDVAEFYLGGDDIPQAGRMTLRRTVASKEEMADNISGTLLHPDHERRTAGKTTVSTKFGEQLQKDRPKSKVEFVTVAAHMQRHNLDEASAREQFDLPENVPLSHAGYWMASSKEAGPKSGTLRYNYYSDDGVGVNAPDKIRGSMPSPAAEAEGTPHKRGWSQTERKLNRVRSEYPDFKSSFVSLEDYAKQREISIAEAAEIFGVDPKEARDHGYIKLQGRPTDEEGGLSVHELNRIRMDSGKQKGSPALMTFRLEGDDKIAVDAVRLTRMFQQKLPYDAVDDIHPTNRMARAFMTGYAALFDRYGPSSRESDAVAKTSTVDESKLTPEQKAKRLAPEKRAKIREQSAEFFGLDDDLVIGYASGSPFTIADVKKLKWRPDDKLDWMHDSKVKQALADMPRARMTDMLGRFNNRLMDAKDQLHADAVEHIKSGGVYLRGDAFLRALRAYKDENGGKVERLQQRVDDINQAIEYDRGESTKDDALQGRISNGGRQGGRMYQAGRRMAARDTLLDQAATLEHVANMSLENAGFANADNVFGGSPAKMKKGVHKAVQDSTGMAKTQGTFTGLRTDNSSTAAAKRMLAMAKEIRDAVLAQDTYHGTDMGDPETSNKSRFLGETMEAISQRMFTANAAQLKMLRNEAKMLNAQTNTMLADGPKKPNGATRKEIQKLADMRDQIDALEAIDKQWIEYQKGDLGSGRTEIDPNGSTTHALRGRTGETPTDLVHRVNQDGSYISHAGPSGHITNNWKEQDAKREALFKLRWELDDNVKKKRDISGHPAMIAKLEAELSELGRVNNTFTEEGAKEFIRSSANSIEAWTDAVRTSKNLGKSPRAPAMAAIDRAARTAERFSHYAALFLPSGYSERLRQAMWDGNKPRNAPDVIAMLGSVVEGAKDAKVLTQRQADLYKEAVAGGELELTAGVKKASSTPETKGKRWVGNPKAAGIEEGSPDPKGVAAKKAAFLKKAVSGDKALIEELSKSDDLKGLQRALAAVGDTELTAGLESTIDAINARINELTQDPAVAYHGQTTKYSAERTGPTSVDGPFSPINGKEILDYIGKTLGNKVMVRFANILHAGDFHTNEVGEHILRVSVHSLNPMSVAYHESLHSFFQRLKEMGRADVVKVLEDAMKSDHVLDQLKTLLAHSPEATKQLSDMEERAAYAYQFWMSGQLKLAPAPKSLFTKIAAAFRKVLGMWTNDQRAEHIFRYFSSGGFAPHSDSNSTLAVHSALMKPGRNFAAEALKSAVEPLARLGDAVVGVGGVRLRETGIPALRELADQIQVIKTVRGSEDEGFLPASRQTRTRLLNKLATYLKDSSAENVDEAMEALQNGVKATSAGGKGAQLMMRKFLKEALDDMRAAGMKVGDLGPNYFPRVWDPLTISKNQDAFLAMLARNNLNEDVMHHLMAHDGSEVMIDFKTDRPGMLHAKERMLNVSAADAAPFLKKDFWNIMNGYVTQMSRRMEWANRFGDDSKKFNDLMKQARKEGATDKHLELAQDYVDGVNGTLGEDVNPTWRRLQSNMIMYQNLRLLPAAIFAQFVDPVGIVVRGGTVRDGFDAFKRGLFEMRKSWQKDPKYDAATELATTLNVIEDVALRNSLSSVHGVGMMEGKLQHLNDQFFRYNFVEGYNQSMRVAGTQAAIRFVMRHASLPSQHSKRWLDEIGLKPSDIKVVNGELAMFERDGLTPAQATKMKNAINRWVDGAVLRPNAADKTIWMSDPHFALIAHMKQFIFSFHQTILKRILHEVEHGNYTPVLAAASYVPIMLAADMAKQVLVNGGDEPEWKKNWGASDYLGHAVARSGLLGVGQFAVDSYQNVQHGGAGITPLLGPTLEQMAEGVSVLAGTRQFEKFVMRSMPANVLYKDYFKDDTVPYPEE